MGLRYRSEMDADPHKPLRDDVRLLGELLGDTVKRFAGEDVFDVVERVRALAKSSRSGNERAFTELARSRSSSISPTSPSSITASDVAARINAIPMHGRSAARARTASRVSSPRAFHQSASTKRSARCRSSSY